MNEFLGGSANLHYPCQRVDGHQGHVWLKYDPNDLRAIRNSATLAWCEGKAPDAQERLDELIAKREGRDTEESEHDMCVRLAKQASINAQNAIDQDAPESATAYATLGTLYAMLATLAPVPGPSPDLSSMLQERIANLRKEV